jgi:hypothetical protein
VVNRFRQMAHDAVFFLCSTCRPSTKIVLRVCPVDAHQCGICCVMAHVCASSPSMNSWQPEHAGCISAKALS